MRAKLKKAKISISQMKAMNEQLPEKQFLEKIKGLPSKQQAAVRACFDAARRKSTKGMKYRNDWLLEFILMRVRSPQLYEHLRRHDILVLPGRSCIRKAMQHFKSGFGFNPSTFDALREKTKTMDDFSRHGLIVFDEMKLSENIEVKSSGKFSSYILPYQFKKNKSVGFSEVHPIIAISVVTYRVK